ncbi:MAG: hypothetical protein HQK55_13235 [Deltaproteobacteria bacterium]|nr:hypothetical protein [Deltaproteobacteria bacterium]
MPAQIFWIDIAAKGKNSQTAPYEAKDLDLAREQLTGLNDAGPETLMTKVPADSPQGKKLLAFNFTRVIRRHDLHGLFSTEPDLSGGFTDVSGFVRDADPSVDVHVFWRGWVTGRPSLDMEPPGRLELCPVPLADIKDFFKNGKAAWEWNADEGRWMPRWAKDIRPGMTLLLNQKQGGYSTECGWTGQETDIPALVTNSQAEFNSLNSDSQSLAIGWQSLENHLILTKVETKRITLKLPLPEPIYQVLLSTSTSHDIGKICPPWSKAALTYVDTLRERAITELTENPDSRESEFFKALLEYLQPPPDQEVTWAKFPNPVTLLSRYDFDSEQEKRILSRLNVRFTPGVRHEAASALALWTLWQRKNLEVNALTVYLVAAHHGKVRTVLRSTKGDDDVYGLHSGLILPPISPWLLDNMELDLSPRYFGAAGNWSEASDEFHFDGPSWAGMVAELLGPELDHDPDPMEAVPDNEPRNLGPLRLAYLEAIVRASDRRASRK